GRAAGGGCGAAVGGRGGAGVGAVDGQRRRDGDFGGQGPGGGDLLGQEFGGWEFGGRHGAPHANSGAVPASFTAPRPIGNVTTPRVGGDDRDPAADTGPRPGAGRHHRPAGQDRLHDRA